MFRRILLLSLLSFAVVRQSPAKAESDAEIPFDFVDGFILLKAEICNGGQPVNLVLDSGAGASVLSLDSARRLHLHLGSTQAVQGVGMQTLANHLEGVSATAAGVTLGPIDLAVDLRNAAVLCHRPIDGLIGVNFFAGRIVQIDFMQHRIRLLSACDRGSSADCRLPIKPYHGALVIPVRVNGSQPRWARLDTGCNDCLHWVVPCTPSHAAPANLSIGFLTDPSNSALSKVQLGNEVLTNVQTSLHAAPLFPGEAGLVGCGVLSRHLVTIDLVHHELYLGLTAQVD